VLAAWVTLTVNWSEAVRDGAGGTPKLTLNAAAPRLMWDGSGTMGVATLYGGRAGQNTSGSTQFPQRSKIFGTRHVTERRGQMPPS